MHSYRIEHVTRYIYSEAVSRAYNLAAVSVENRPGQKVISHNFTVFPGASVLQYQRDYFGNRLAWFSLEQPHQRFEVKAETHIEIDRPEIDLENGLTWEESVASAKSSLYEDELHPLEFTLDSPHIALDSREHYLAYVHPFFPAGKPLLKAVFDLVLHIFQNFKFEPGISHIHTQPLETLERKSGVCQDFTHLSLALLRSLGIPARYVSGYIETYPPKDGRALQGADATHAWISVLHPQLGWIDFDPTNGKTVGNEYIVTAIGRDFSDVSPLRGVLFGGGEHKLEVSVKTERL